ncbi:MAG: phage terminase large subunit [Candidatus Anammoxibacter sp.]
MDTPLVPSEKQRIALQYLYDNQTNFIGYGGSGFSGKSYVLTRWITNMCLQYPGVGYGIARKTLIDLKKTTLLTLFKVFKELNVTDQRDYNYNGQLNTIEFDNGSTIFLIEMAYKPSDPLFTRLGGYELTGAGVDESVECPIEAINILYTRLGRRKNKEYNITSKLLETFNPAKNHVYRRYYKPDREGILKDTYKFIPALPADNPSPETKEYVQGIIENSDKITIERLIYGNFEYDDDPAKLMEYDNIVDLFTNDFVGKDDKGELMSCDSYISADIARFGGDMGVFMVWQGYRVVEIQSHAKTSIPDSVEIINELANKYGVPRSRIVVDEDGVGGGVQDLLKCKGFVANSTPIEVKGKKENYNNLKSQCYFRLADKVNKNELFIDCVDTTVIEKITEELEVIKQKDIDKDNKMAIIPKDKVKELIGRSPDYSDCLMMRFFLDLKKTGILATV